MKRLRKITFRALVVLGLFYNFFSCKKDKVTTSSSSKVQFSQDSVLFDTVFTSIGSATQNIRVRNKNAEKIIISTIQLAGGSGSFFKINVDGQPGTLFKSIEIAAHDSMYIFLQVNVNPNNANSPFIIQDSLLFTVNGNLQKVQLEAWGQNAYYHRATDAITFSDGTFLAYSRVSQQNNAVVTWVNDKPHVIYDYLVVDSTQKLIINAGVRVYLNYKAALWVYRYGELNVFGQKGNEVTFQGARREPDYLNAPGQWDRIWINEGGNNIIDYAIIKNGYIGVQTDLFYDVGTTNRNLQLTNTRIQNMSKWGLYCSYFNLVAGNDVISKCQEYSVNLLLGGSYTFLNCTMANDWDGDQPRTLPTVNINNYNSANGQNFPLGAYFGNCIIDGTLQNELALDFATNIPATSTLAPTYTFSSCWVKSTDPLSDPNHYFDIRKGSSSLQYQDTSVYNFQPKNEPRVQGFNGPYTARDAAVFPTDINGVSRPTVSVSAGAYQVP